MSHPPRKKVRNIKTKKKCENCVKKLENSKNLNPRNTFKHPDKYHKNTEKQEIFDINNKKSYEISIEKEKNREKNPRKTENIKLN